MRKWLKSSFWTRKLINNFQELISMIKSKNKRLIAENTIQRILFSITIRFWNHTLMERISKRLIFLKSDGMRFQLIWKKETFMTVETRLCNCYRFSSILNPNNCKKKLSIFLFWTSIKMNTKLTGKTGNLKILQFNKLKTDSW